MANLIDVSKRMVGALRHCFHVAVLEEQTGWISIARLAVLVSVGEDVIQQRSLMQIAEIAGLGLKQRIEPADSTFGLPEAGVSHRA